MYWTARPDAESGRGVASDNAHTAAQQHVMSHHYIGTRTYAHASTFTHVHTHRYT